MHIKQASLLSKEWGPPQYIKNYEVYKQRLIKTGKQISKNFFTDNKNTEEVIVKEITNIMVINKC
jgi:hypothetical protein